MEGYWWLAIKLATSEDELPNGQKEDGVIAIHSLHLFDSWLTEANFLRGLQADLVKKVERGVLFCRESWLWV